MRIHIILFHVLYTMTESSTMTWTICKIIPIHLVYIDRQENVTEFNNISYFFRKKEKKEKKEEKKEEEKYISYLSPIS